MRKTRKEPSSLRNRLLWWIIDKIEVVQARIEQKLQLNEKQKR